MVLDRPEPGYAQRRRVRVLQHEQRRRDVRVPGHSFESDAEHPVAEGGQQDGLVFEPEGRFQGELDR